MVATLRHVVCVLLHGLSFLQGLPETIALTPALTELDLSGCSSILRLPNAFCDLELLQHLSLGEGLSELPDDFGRFSQLKTMRAHNLFKVKTLPPMGGLTSLEELHMPGWSSLTELPDDLFTLPRLASLSLGLRPIRAPLTSLPETIGQLKALETLDLEKWFSLSRLPDSICELHALRSLQLHGCFRLTELPANIGQLTNLESLDIGQPQFGGNEGIESGLVSLPESLSKLASS